MSLKQYIQMTYISLGWNCSGVLAAAGMSVFFGEECNSCSLTLGMAVR